VTQELTQGPRADTRPTRFGLRSKPWQGGEVLASMGRDGGEFGPRVHANLGLRQTWKIGPRWFLDGSFDRSQTLGAPDTVRLDDSVPPASGGTQDFTALSLGTAYHSELWQFNVRAEVLSGAKEDRWSLSPAVLVEPRRGLGLAAGGRAFLTRGPTDRAHADLRLGLSWQVLHSWTLLDRLDLIIEEEQGLAGPDSRRIVNNLNLNRRFSRFQLALQYGSKYVAAEIGAMSATGYTDLTGIEARYDLDDRWDLGTFTSVLHSWNLETYDFRGGASLGLNVVRDVWAQAGYNFAGFEDRDFSAGSFTAHGPFLRLTVRFDDDALALLGLGYRAREETSP